MSDLTKLTVAEARDGLRKKEFSAVELTKAYISKVLNRITVLGAILLTFIALLPYVLSIIFGLPYQAAVGGTGIIIVVGVALETVKQLEGQLTQKSYKRFFE